MIEPASPENIARAGELLRVGKLVAFPTETVYGLGADATSDEAVARVFEAKGRPTFNPLIVHVPDVATAVNLVEFNDTAQRLVDTFWPGALSLVLPRADNSAISLLASAGLDTIAIRIPDHTAAKALLYAAGTPIAAPSANASGKISPTRAEHVAESLGNKVPLIIDDGPCLLGLESTVIDCTHDIPAMLRPGIITVEQIESIVGETLAPVGDITAASSMPASPGMLQSHYAPTAKILLNASSINQGENLLSFGRHRISGMRKEQNLSPSGNLREAAANLFTMMRLLDDQASIIAVTPIPEEGLGLAINDRLRRAAAPRDVRD
jgi:L-threonylcarbamoyladenylate synthase